MYNQHNLLKMGWLLRMSNDGRNRWQLEERDKERQADRQREGGGGGGERERERERGVMI